MLRICLCMMTLFNTYGLNHPQKIRTLARENFKLVHYFSKPYIRKYDFTYEEKRELIQYGYEGFVRACCKYDDTKGYKLSTYSHFCIRKYMDDYVKLYFKNKGIMPLNENYDLDLVDESPLSILDNYQLDLHEYILLKKKFFQQETFVDIAKQLNVSRDTLRNKYKKIFSKIRTQHNKRF